MFRLVKYYPASHQATTTNSGRGALPASECSRQTALWNIILSLLPEDGHSADFYQLLSFYFILFAFSYNFIALGCIPE